MKNTYYELRGNLNGKDELLFGSFEESDCESELDAEKHSYKAEGFKKLRIVSRQTEDTPDPEIYEEAILVSPLQKTETIPQRYFAYDFNTTQDVELVEVSKETFDSIEGETTTERHTMFTNGCNQICHTKENY